MLQGGHVGPAESFLCCVSKTVCSTGVGVRAGSVYGTYGKNVFGVCLKKRAEVRQTYKHHLWAMLDSKT